MTTKTYKAIKVQSDTIQPGMRIVDRKTVVTAKHAHNGQMLVKMSRRGNRVPIVHSYPLGSKVTIFVEAS